MNLKHQKLIVAKTLSLIIMFIASISFIHAQTTYGTNAGTTGSFGTFIGAGAGQYNTATHNTFVGYNSGKNNLLGNYNTYVGVNTGSNRQGNGSHYNSFLGYGAGHNITSGDYNTFLGSNSGNSTTSGHRNTYSGFNAGRNTTSGSYNTYSGINAGINTTAGHRNTYLGANAGARTTSGRYNTYLGYNAGYQNITGTHNLFLGYQAGYFETGSYKLIIETNASNGDRYSPLIYGDFAKNYVGIAINTDPANSDIVLENGNSPYGLYVGKGILTEKVKVATRGTTEWADYVFETDYDLNSTEEVEAFVKKNKHLPNVPSAQEVNENGVDMVEMDATLLRQIEELWLHVIELKKENNTLKEVVKTLSNK